MISGIWLNYVSEYLDCVIVCMNICTWGIGILFLLLLASCRCLKFVCQSVLIWTAAWDFLKLRIIMIPCINVCFNWNSDSSRGVGLISIQYLTVWQQNFCFTAAQNLKKNIVGNKSTKFICAYYTENQITVCFHDLCLFWTEKFQFGNYWK